MPPSWPRDRTDRPGRYRKRQDLGQINRAERAAPVLGQHNAEILAELGYGPEAIEVLKAQKVIGDWPEDLRETDPVLAALRGQVAPCSQNWK